MEREANKLTETQEKLCCSSNKEGVRWTPLYVIYWTTIFKIFFLTLNKANHSKIIRLTMWAFPRQTLHKLHRFPDTLHSNTDSWSCRICYCSCFTVIGQLSKCKLPSRWANCYNTIRYKVVFCVKAQEFIREHMRRTLSARVRSLLHRTIC